MRKFLILLTLVFPLIATAQSVRGLVMDEAQSPMPFSNVILLQDSVYMGGTITNEQGQFLFENVSPKANVIKITMTGYDDYVSAIPASGDFGIVTLVPSSIMLGEVVVKAALPKTQLKGNSMVTNVQNTVLSKMGTAYDVLSHIPLVTGSNGELEVFGRGAPTFFRRCL